MCGGVVALALEAASMVWGFTLLVFMIAVGPLEAEARSTAESVVFVGRRQRVSRQNQDDVQANVDWI